MLIIETVNINITAVSKSVNNNITGKSMPTQCINTLVIRKFSHNLYAWYHFYVVLINFMIPLAVVSCVYIAIVFNNTAIIKQASKHALHRHAGGSSVRRRVRKSSYRAMMSGTGMFIRRDI